MSHNSDANYSSSRSSSAQDGAVSSASSIAQEGVNVHQFQDMERPDGNSTPMSSDPDLQPFEIKIFSRYVSDGPNTRQPNVFLCNMLLHITLRCNFASFKQAFRRQALEHHFPHLEKWSDNSWPGALIPGMQSFEMDARIGEDDERVDGEEGNWSSVKRRLRDGEGLTISWWVNYVGDAPRDGGVD